MIVRRFNAPRVALLAAGVLFAVFLLRPVFAQSVDLASYTSKEAEAWGALPPSGPNFSTHSWIGSAAGRMYLKGKTAATILAAYKELEVSAPGVRFLYGEMGLNGGGIFWPHRTHRDGLSADFMTPMRRQSPEGASPAAVPCHIFNLWGYGVRVDSAGRSGDLRLDEAALTAHIAALNTVAPRYGLRVRRVILDPPLLALLRKHPDFSRIARTTFMAQKAWFPHDGHYHVDFSPAGL